MNILIVYAHPNPKSFCHAILDTVQQALIAQGHEVHVRDLYALNFNPILSGADFVSFKSGKIPTDISVEQVEIRWAHIIVVINPVWWTSMPAILKGYFDRVFSYGFAFGAGTDGRVKGLLADKKVFIFNTMGNSREMYDQSGMFKSMIQTISQGVFEFSAMHVLGHHFFTSVTSSTPQQRESMLKEAEAIVSKF